MVLKNGLSFYTENRKSDFLMLGQGDTLGINGRFDAPENKIQTFVWVCIKMVITVTCLSTEKKPLSLKQIRKMSTFHCNFVSEAYLINL